MDHHILGIDISHRWGRKYRGKVNSSHKKNNSFLKKKNLNIRDSLSETMLAIIIIMTKKDERFQTGPPKRKKKKGKKEI